MYVEYVSEINGMGFLSELQMEMIKLKKQYIEPDKNNVNNYMLDTSAYNYIVRNIGILEILKQSVSYGFCYYSTAIQDRELSGEGAKTYNNKCIPIRMKSMDPELTKNFELVDEKLNVKLVSEVASCMRNHARLDGTNRFASTESLEGTILVSNDAELRNMVNSIRQNGAITVDELLEDQL